MKIQVILTTDEEMENLEDYQKDILLRGDIDEINAAIESLKDARQDRVQRMLFIDEGI